MKYVQVQREETMSKMYSYPRSWNGNRNLRARARKYGAMYLNRVGQRKVQHFVSAKDPKGDASSVLYPDLALYVSFFRIVEFVFVRPSVISRERHTVLILSFRVYTSLVSFVRFLLHSNVKRFSIDIKIQWLLYELQVLWHPSIKII